MFSGQLAYLKNVVVLCLFSRFYSPESALLRGRDSRGQKFLEKLKKKTSVAGHKLTVLFCFDLVTNNSIDTLTANVIAVLLFDCLPLIVLSLQVHDSSSPKESLLIRSTTDSKQIYG